MNATSSRRLKIVFVQLPVALCLIWVLLASLKTEAATSHVSRLSAPLFQPLLQAPPLPQSLGVICGQGEKLPANVICLHGLVIDAVGNPVNGAVVTVTANNRTITTTTFVHPNSTTPSYTLDLSSLQLQFLQVITVSATDGNTHTKRKVIAYPDFTDQTQHLDLRLRDATGLNASICLPGEICGQVIDYIERMPIAGATITIKASTVQSKTVITTVVSGFQADDPVPGFRFTPSALGIPPSSVITMTVNYNNDRDQRAIPWNGQAQEVNFVTDWKCDQGSISKGGGAFGLPNGGRGGGAFGLPDLACLWGFGLHNSIPTAKMEVRLVISGVVYSGETQLFPGEDQPRFGILVPASQIVTGTAFIATLSYGGAAVNQVVTPNLDSSQSQQINLNLTSAKAVGNDGDRNFIKAIAFQEWQGHRYVWTGTPTGGILRWDLTAQPVTYTQFTTLDGLRSNNITSIVVDKSQWVWAAHSKGDLSLYDPNMQQWRIIKVSDSEIIDQLSRDNCDHLVTNNSGIMQIENVGTEKTSLFRISPLTNTGYLESEPDCDLWFMYSKQGYPALGFLKYNSSTKLYADTWQDISVPEPISGTGYLSLFDAQGYLWFTGRQMVGRFTVTDAQPPSLGEWKPYTIPTDLSNQFVTPKHVDAHGRLWAISLAGALYLTPTQENWGMISSAQGLPYKRATAIASDPWNGDIWIGTVRGLSQHDVTTLQQKKVYVAGAPVQFRDQEGVMVAVDDVFGGTLIGTGAPGAAYYYSPTAQTWKTLTVTIDYGQGLPLGYGISGITCITVDKTRGDAWFCDDGGVNHWNPSASQPYTRAMTIKEGLGFAVISAISVVGNNLWVASSAGIYVYDIQSRSLITSYTTANASWLLSNNVFDMEVVGSDFWFGTEGGVSMFNPTTGLTKTITTNTPGSQLPFKAVEKLSIGKDGLLWLGGLECFDGSCNERGGISSPYDTLHDHWVSLPGLPIIDQKLQVNDIFIDDQNSPWFGVTIDNNNRWGLGHYNRKTRTFERFTEQDGLPGPNVYGISPLKDGGLLLAVEGLGRWEIPKPQSDLAIQLQTPAIVVAGTNTVYTLTVTNRGDGDAIDPRVTLTLPPTVTYVSATPSPIVHQMLTWNLPTVTAGSAVTLVINVTVSPEAREGTRLLARATVTSTSPDTFLPDNSEQTVARVRNGVDVGVSLIGPPMVQAGGAISFTVVAENIGGAPAEHVTVTANNGGNCAIPKIEPGQHIACTLTETAPNNAEILSANVRVSTTSGDRDEANNSASTTVAILPKPEPGQPISLPQKSTLILVAPSRLEGSSLVMPLVNQLAQHPTVKGLVVDVTADSNVAAAYQQWDTLPQSSIAANQVVSTIKQLVEQYRRQFPDLHYLVIVGGDHVIPFYRVPDGVQGPEALWQERKYAPYVNANDQAVRAAFDHNMILTDDFLAAPAGGVSVYSSFWTAPNQKTYVPELAVGRLVEHADEIVATLNAFLSGERRFNSAAATVFAEPGLTDDLGRQQCLTLGRDGNCVQSADKLTLGMPAAPTVLLLGAVHSNHHSTGAMELEDSDEFDARFHQRFAQPFIVSIGCHTGLNLADELDLVEAFLRLGGTFIGPTTYAYATEEQMAYSEALAEELTGLLQSGLPPGDALIQAKRKYFTMRAGNNTTLGWFDTLDEKVLLPLTLYGLPMSNGQEAANYRLHGTVAASVQPEQAAVLSTTITLADLDYKLQPQQYYSLIGGKLKRNGDTVTDVEQGQLIVQAGQPIQPGLSLSLPTFITPTVLLQSATYVNHPGLAIKRAQARVIGEADQPALPQLQVTEPVSWDHPLPFAVSFLQATEQQQGEVWLNFALGAFIADSQTERLFSALSLSVLPGDGNRRFDPGLITTGDIASPGEITTMLQARILSWDKPIRVLGVCDIPTGDNAGQYTAVEMIWLPQSQLWQGTCTGIAERFYIQVIDSGNNTTNTPWLLPTGQLLPPLPLQSIYLPMVMTDSGFVDNQQQADDVEQDMTVFLPLITK